MVPGWGGICLPAEPPRPTSISLSSKVWDGVRSIVVQDRADAAALGKKRVAAVAEQVDVESFVRLPLAVSLHLDRDCLRRLAWGKGQRAALGDVVLAGL